MMTIVWSNDTSSIIDEIRNTIGRGITINIPVTGIACTNILDSLDPVTNLSTNQFCAVCGGKYWLNTISGVSVSAVIIWKGAEINNQYPGGYVVDGDCSVQIKYTVTSMDWIDRAISYIVDGRTLVKKSIALKGVKPINRIIITLDEKER